MAAPSMHLGTKVSKGDPPEEVLPVNSMLLLGIAVDAGNGGYCVPKD